MADGAPEGDDGEEGEYGEDAESEHGEDDPIVNPDEAMVNPEEVVPALNPEDSSWESLYDTHDMFLL